MTKIQDLKKFAFIWAIIFGIVGVYPIINSNEFKIWSISISVAFVLVGVFIPIILNIFYKIWIKFGEFMGRIISTIIMFILYFGLFTPISLFLKLLGKDLLNKKMDRSQNTYWVDRETQPQSMKNQF
jgi:hypothetical protein